MKPSKAIFKNIRLFYLYIYGHCNFFHSGVLPISKYTQADKEANSLFTSPIIPEKNTKHLKCRNVLSYARFFFTLKKSAFYMSVLISSLPLFLYSQVINDSAYIHYCKLNENEKRLEEFKDNENDLRLKLKQVEVINNSRGKYGVGKVELDIFASRLANKICREAAQNNYTGHWNKKGEKPYHRNAFDGGFDHIAENAAGKSTSGTFEQSNDFILSAMKELHLAFMSEKAPDDGHKMNCVDRIHNFVGIGFFLNNKQFRYYEEFIDHYYSFEQVPIKAKVNEEIYIKAKPSPNYYFCYLVAYKDKPIKKMSANKLKAQQSYKDYTNNKALIIKPWSFPKYRTEEGYKIPLKFTKQGIYYIHLYQDMKEYRTPKSFSTEGKIQASGIVIMVNK